jgi:PAS domain S-box-containing protein
MNDCIPEKNSRILVIDDNRSIHEDIRKILAPSRPAREELDAAKALVFGESRDETPVPTCEIDSAFQGREGLQRVEDAAAAGRPYAMAFVDVRMPPGWDGIETVTQLWKKHADLQVVLCTAYSDYSWEETIRKLGKSDSLLVLKKPFDNIEVLQLAHALTEKWALNHQLRGRLNNLDQLVQERTNALHLANEELKKEIAERMQTEKALRLAEERFSKAFKASPIPLAIQSFRQETFVDVNDGFETLTGFSRGELMGHTTAELLLWGGTNQGAEILQVLYQDMAVRNKVCQLHTKAGQTRDVLLSVELFELGGEPFMLIIAQDITEQIKLENQLRQSQKLEAIGQLAAGVAHDFNNILLVISGNASLLLEGRAEDCKDHRPLTHIHAAADRAAKLVRQLLTFSRKQVAQILPMPVSDILIAVNDMLPRLLGASINVRVSVPEDLPSVKADAGMMEQLFMNLAINARDAMPNGGTLSFEAKKAVVEAQTVAAGSGHQPGNYICVSVSDTGCGISAENLSRIFEPFFTTKPVGKGTGLGLSTVYGIAKQHGGWVDVESQVGVGTTFRVYIPVHEKAAKVAKPADVPRQRMPGGLETILLAEDEEDVRDFVAEVLKSYGYKVFAAPSGVAALELWSYHKGKVDLLLTDLVMPGGVSGHALADRLLAENPALKVIFTSGYSPGMAANEVACVAADNFLAKPFNPAKLLQMIRQHLDEPACHEEAVAPS